MVKITSNKGSVKASTGKLSPGDKTLGLESAIIFYTLESGDETSEEE